METEWKIYKFSETTIVIINIVNMSVITLWLLLNDLNDATMTFAFLNINE